MMLTECIYPALLDTLNIYRQINAVLFGIFTGL